MAHAATNNIVLADGPVSTQALEGHIDYYLDPEWDKTVADMIGPYADKFQTVDRSEPDFGYTKNKIWLRFTVKNQTENTDEWRLHVRENFMQVIDVYVHQQAEGTEKVMSLGLDSKFEARPIEFPQMVAPIHIEPGETATVFIAYWSGGSSNLPFSLETTDSFSKTAVNRMAKNYIYYGMMAILIMAAFAALLIMRQPVFLAYIAYAVSAVMFLMHADGLAFQHLWASFPAFNASASIVTGGALAVFCANYARVFLQTKDYHPAMDKLLLVFLVIVPIICFSALIVDPQPIKKIMVFVALITVGLCTIAGINAGRKRFREVRFYILAWAGGVVASLIMNMRHIIGIDIAQDLEFDSIRIAMVFDAAMMGLAIADRFNHLRRSRQRAMQKSLDDAERNLLLNSRLHELERQYELATDLAQTRDQEMKNTVHDLRQPLHALRLNVKNLIDKGAANGDGTANINETFAYLEDLMASHLQSSIVPTDYSLDDQDKQLNVPDILKSIHDMFLPDALEKGLIFDYVPTRYNAKIEPLVLMRIISNLVSNAIKYTSSGKILLGTRKQGDRLRIEVHDTGSGMTQAEFQDVQKREVRLERDKDTSEGQGYGLAIASDLARKNDLKLYLAKDRKTGTGIILDVKLS